MLRRAPWTSVIPQRVVCTIDEYLEKRQSVQLDEAYELYYCWRRNSLQGKRGRPLIKLFHDFFRLFEERGEEGLEGSSYEQVMGLCWTYE